MHEGKFQHQALYVAVVTVPLLDDDILGQRLEMG